MQDTAGARDAHTLGHGGCERRAHAPESGVEAMHDSEPARMHLQCALPEAAAWFRSVGRPPHCE